MARAPIGQEDRSWEQTDADLTGERLPASSSAEVVRRHERRVAANDKRARRLADETSAKASRDGLMARLWYNASLGAPWVTPAVREHFVRCVAACLANENVRFYLGDRSPGWSESSLESSPIVRVEFEHAFVLGRLGESLCAARHKGWGEFLGVRPLEARDPVHPLRVAYAFKEAAPYQRRFDQRRRLRRMLGKEYAR